MNPQDVLDYSLTKPGSYVDFPFGDEPVCVKLAGRIFVQVYSRRVPPMATLKCAPSYAEALRHLYPGTVVRGYHCPPMQQPHWNTIYFRQEIGSELWREMIDHAYDAVVAKLPKKARKELGI